MYIRTEIQQLVKSQLAHYEYPREIEFVESLPMTTTGKIQRAELRALEIKRQAEAARQNK
jgi:acetyl-CoA synthetase